MGLAEPVANHGVAPASAPRESVIWTETLETPAGHSTWPTALKTLLGFCFSRREIAAPPVVPEPVEPDVERVVALEPPEDEDAVPVARDAPVTELLIEPDEPAAELPTLEEPVVVPTLVPDDPELLTEEPPAVVIVAPLVPAALAELEVVVPAPLEAVVPGPLIEVNDPPELAPDAVVVAATVVEADVPDVRPALVEELLAAVAEVAAVDVPEGPLPEHPNERSGTRISANHFMRRLPRITSSAGDVTVQ